MPRDTPIFLFFFSNDQAGSLGLGQEQIATEKALQALHEAGTIEYKAAPFTNLESLYDNLDRYNNRICIFHYGGHSDARGLDLADTKIKGENLATILGQQKNLQLVFLNGCANAEQVELLWNEGVKAIIATSAKIGDDLALHFCERFYKALASGHTLQQAFEKATSFINNEDETLSLNFYRGQGLPDLLDESFPWGLYVQHDPVLNWSINNIEPVQLGIKHYLTDLPSLEDEIIGREKDIANLKKALESSQRVVLMNGMGGIGKTTTAIAYANRYKDQYTHIVWLEQVGDFAADLASNSVLTKNLGISRSDDPEADARHILNTLSNLDGSSLLVIDNGDEQLKKYKNYFPKTPNWQVLITSRQELSFAKKLPLDFLAKEDALALFYSHYDLDQNDKLAYKILQTLDYHTLTIEILAKTAQNLEIATVDRVAKLLKERGIKIGKPVDFSTIAHSKADQSTRLFPYLKAIFALPKFSDQEIFLLKQFVGLPPTFMKWKAVTELLQVTEEEEPTWDALLMARNKLKKKGWIIFDEEQQAYKMHRIIQDVVVEHFEIEEEDVSDLLDTLIKLTAYSSKRNPMVQFQWIPYGKQLLSIIGARHSIKVSNLYNNIAMLYRAQGSYEQALTFFQKAIEIREAVLAPQHTGLASSYNNIGSLYNDQGHYKSALTFFQKAIEIKEAILDPQHPSLATSYNNIGLLYKYQGRYEQALTFFQKAIEINEAVLDPQQQELVFPYNNIGSLYKDQGRYEESLIFFQKAIEICEAVLDPQHPDLAMSYNNIAGLYHDQGRYVQALTFFQKAIEIWEVSLGNEHPYTQIGIKNLEALKQEMKKKGE